MRLRRWLWFAALGVMSAVGILAVMWGPAIRAQVAKKLQDVPKRWDGRAAWQSISVRGISVEVKGLTFFAADPAAPPVFFARSLTVEPDLLALLQGKRALARLALDSAHVFLAVDSVNARWNIERPAPSQPDLSEPDTSSVEPERRFPDLVPPSRWLLESLMSRQFPSLAITRTSAEIRWAQEDLKVDHIRLFLTADSLRLSLKGPEIQAEVEGVFSDTSLQVQLQRPIKAVVPLPDAFALRGAASSGFLTVRQHQEGRFSLQGGAEGVQMASRALASAPLDFDQLAFSSNWVFSGSRSVEVESAFTLEALTVQHRFLYRDGPPAPFTRHTIELQPAEAGAYRSSLPEPLLGALAGMEFRGRLGYRADLEIDFAALDSLKLEAGTERQEFQLLRTGIDFERLNGAFEQPVYDGLAVKRTVFVGRANPMYLALNHVPQHLIDAILTNEDVSFFNHRGFSAAAFRGALADNIRAGRFKRGASTLSMQLVKNVFLTREKTVARKFQELIITWLMEESRLVSKEAMFEIYLNIIEWGPDVYGIGEAARFYFNKTPGQLSLEESLFLASIIPAPKKFNYRFKNGALRESHLRGMAFVARKMEQFAFIPEGRAQVLRFETLQFSPAVRSIVGEAPLPAD